MPINGILLASLRIFSCPILVLHSDSESIEYNKQMIKEGRLESVTYIRRVSKW